MQALHSSEALSFPQSLPRHRQHRAVDFDYDQFQYFQCMVAVFTNGSRVYNDAIIPSIYFSVVWHNT